MQQVSAAEFGLLQGGFAAHAKTAPEPYSTFFSFLIFDIPRLTCRNSVMLKTTNSTLESLTIANVAIKQDHKKKSVTLYGEFLESYERGVLCS